MRKYDVRGRKGVVLLGVLLIGTLVVLVSLRTTQGRLSGLPVREPVRTYRSMGASSTGGDPIRDNANAEGAITTFQRWMDSLRNDWRGRRIYDSICKVRPRLLDSARHATEYYFLHQLLN